MNILIFLTFVVSFLFLLFFLMIRRPPRSTRTDTLFPYTTLFRSAHLRRVGAEGGEGVVEQRRADDADLQALQVLRLADRVLRVRDLAEAVLGPGERLDALLVQDLEQPLADRAAGERIDRGVVRHQERDRQSTRMNSSH